MYNYILENINLLFLSKQSIIRGLDLVVHVSERDKKLGYRKYYFSISLKTEYRKGFRFDCSYAVKDDKKLGYGRK